MLSFAKWVTMWLSHSDDIQIKGNIPLSIMVHFVNTIKKYFHLFQWIFFIFSLLTEDVWLVSAAKIIST